MPSNVRKIKKNYFPLLQIYAKFKFFREKYLNCSLDILSIYHHQIKGRKKKMPKIFKYQKVYQTIFLSPKNKKKNQKEQNKKKLGKKKGN